MPRTPIDLPDRVDYLSVLDENGNLDKDLEPNIPDELLLKLYRAMIQARRFDERMRRLQRQGRLGTFAPIKGQEASQLGPVAALRESDWLVPAFREAAAEAWRGRTLESILLYYGGFNQGGAVPEGSTGMPGTIPVGTQILHAAGLGYAIKYRKDDSVSMAFFGDGATSEGDFHEGLNFAAVFQVPTIFVCQNNHWAISLPRERQTRSKTLAQKALAYGMPGIQVDGNDVLATYAAAHEAVERARAGEGPTFIEAVTYRLSVHTTADDPTRYRKEQEVEEWQKKDPIPRFQKYLVDRGLLDEGQIAQVEQEVENELKEVVDRAEAQMKELENEPMIMFEHLYAELPPYLQEQKEELARELAQKEDSHG
ncbi:MAG TPA: pyruvate dehydrogenase (acetyl-transferring) E1 component subunit alpha [Anaerolineae bacterium]|nr:pyruvate dehydrogenase (acetyl-transferring) E1 component subunit alpha [Anaerolineae bacterium]